MDHQSDHCINISGIEYRLERLLAETRSCRVWAAVEEATDRSVAIKAFHTLSAETMQSIIGEVALYNDLPEVVCKRFVPFYHHGCWRDGYAFVMARMDTDLSGVSFGHHRPQILARLWLDIAQALHCLHSNGYLHLDLKPENILCNYELERFYLGDFGTLKALSAPARTVSSGTPGWMAPEQRYRQLDAAGRQVYALSVTTDIHAFGLLMYALITDRLPSTDEGLPFEGGLSQPDIETLQRHLHSLAFEPCLSQQLGKMIEQCLRCRPDERPTDLSALIRLLTSLNGGPDATGPAPFRSAQQLPPSAVIPLMLDSPEGPSVRGGHRGVVMLALLLAASLLSYELMA